MLKLTVYSSVQFSSVTVMSNSSRPHESQHTRPPCHHQLPEFTQTHIHRVRDAIQPSHPLSSPSPPVPSPSQHQSFPMSQLFAWGGQSTGASALASFLQGKPVRGFSFFTFYFYKNEERPVGRQAVLFWTCVCLHLTWVPFGGIDRNERNIIADSLKMPEEKGGKHQWQGAAVLDNIFVPLYETWSFPSLTQVINTWSY